MAVKLVDLLLYSVLKEARVVAGAGGLNKSVRSVSINEIRFDDNVGEERGMLYLTSFRQFADKTHEVLPWVQKRQADGISGLCTFENCLHLVGEDTISFCDAHNFPLLAITTNLSYAEIMENINIILYFSNVHMENAKRLHHMIYDKLNRQEVLETVKQINPAIKDHITILLTNGTPATDIDNARLNQLFTDKPHNFYVKFEDKHVFILSGPNEARQKQNNAASFSLLQSMFPLAAFGQSPICNIYEFDKAFQNAVTALDMACLSGQPYVVYDPVAELTLLLPLRNSDELRDFYNTIINRLYDSSSADKTDFVACMREYVLNGGDYQAVAKKLFQHENTIRYRVNKIKSILGLQHDTIKFHTMLSLFVAIDQIYHGPNQP